MTSNGGNQFGTIFKYPIDSNKITYSYSYNGFQGNNPVFNKLILASNGKYYGLTSKGGNFDKGIIYEYQPITNYYKKLFDFNDSLGATPFGSLIQASNNKLYGTTFYGGLNSFGVLFEFNLSNNTYKKLFDFNGINGQNPLAPLLEASNGKLYSTTQNGGINGKGILFEFNYISNTFTKLIDFNNSIGTYPLGSLLEYSPGLLYGTTSQGGPNTTTDYGVIFSYNFVNSTYSVKKSFIYSTGWNPSGEFTKTPTGKLYGTATTGGINGKGCIFEYDPVSNTYNDKFHFSQSSGYQSCKSLLLATNGKMYGANFSGGSYSFGTVFEYDYLSNAYVKLHDFQSSFNGINPEGSLVQVSNKLYGTTTAGGICGVGVMYEVDLTGNLITKKFDFASSEAATPNGSFIFDNNNKLYGLTFSGGTSNAGTIIEFDPVTNTFVKKFDFSSLDGTSPYGSLIKSASGRYYGITNSGGTNNYGVLFEYNPSSNIFSKKFDFTSSVGMYPLGTLCQASNGKLYGITKLGGVGSMGVIFEYDTLTNLCIKKIDIAISPLNSNPYVKMVEAQNSKLYCIIGTMGGPYNGTLIEYDYTLNAISNKHSFSTFATGINPNGYLTLANGKLYSTALGGNNSSGVIFEYDPITSNFQKIYDFNVTEGPCNGALFLSSNGKLYGLSQSGGAHNCGSIFEFDHTLLSYNKKYDFKCDDGYMPNGNSFIEVNLASNNIINNNNLSDKILKLYPNPTTNKVNIQILDLSSIIEIKLYNTDCINIYNTQKIKSNEFVIDLNSQPSGIYLLEVQTIDGFFRRKIIKQ